MGEDKLNLLFHKLKKTHKTTVGANLLAMDVNDNAGFLTARVVFASIASRLAPTGGIAFNPTVGSTALRPTLATVTGFLTFAEEHLVAHDRFVRVFGLHVLDIIIVVGHADHQARGLTEVFTEATKVIEHAADPRLRVRQRLEG
jgi:hypothetical protein